MSFPNIITKFNKAKNHHLVINESSSTATLTATDSSVIAYESGLQIDFVFPFDNVASTTLNINDLGAKALFANNQAAGAKTFLSGSCITFIYDAAGNSNAGCWKALNHDSSFANGLVYGTCDTAAATAAKTLTAANFKLKTGALIGIKFTYNVPANSTLNVNSTGAKNIYNNGNNKITAGVINAGDTAIFQYDGSQYRLLNVVPANAGVLDIAHGGTGATTASDVLTNLGFTASLTELNYTDGVTSDIQTQLNGKAVSSHTHGNITNDGKVGSTANLPLITGTDGVVSTGSFGNAANTFCEGNDSRLSDSRTPKSHSHGNISNSGAVGTASGKPLITGTDGVVQAGSFGSASGTFCEGNDARLSDARTPVAHTHSASDVSGTLDASNIPSLDASKITSGTIDIARLPAGAIPTFKVVANETARFALTTSDVQNGDTVQQEDTGRMYYVKDDTKLNSTDGYAEYTAGAASTVPWSGVTDKPGSFTPASHTHGNLTNDGKVGSTANLPLITGTGGAVTTGSFGNSANTFCEGNDSRLSDSRTPTSHTHGNITNDGKVGSTSGLPLITGTGGAVQAGSFGNSAGTFCEGNDSRLSDTRTPKSHTHGNITNAGAIGSTSGLPIITTTDGVLTAGSFGNSAGTFCQGNDSRLSDSRTPKSHTHGNVTNGGLLGTASRVVVTDGDKKIDVSSVTSTELGYLTGVTSAIQDQLNGKAASSHGTHVSYSTDDPAANGTASAGSASTVARSDHVHPLQTSVSGNAGTATTLATARTIDGVSFDGSAAIIHFGTCGTDATTAAKTASVSGFALTTGAWAAIKFSVTNTASNPTLNINSTGDKSIFYRGSAISAGYLAAGRVYLFVYDGTNYELVGDINTDTNTKVTQTKSDTSNATYSVLLMSDANANADKTNTSRFSTKIKANPSTGVLSATTFTGNLTGDVTGSVSGSSGSCTGNAATASSAAACTGNSATADAVNHSLVLKIKSGSTEGTDLYTFNGSADKTLDITQGSNITLTPTAGGLAIAAKDSTYSNMSLGNGYATQNNASQATAVTATLSNYALVSNGHVTVKFTYAVLASSTLNINSKGAKAIYHNNAAIKANVIAAGDFATFVYDGSYYHLVAIAPRQKLDTTQMMHDIPYQLEQGRTYWCKVSGVFNPAMDSEVIKFSISSSNANITFSKSSNIAQNEYFSITVPSSVTLGSSLSFTLSFTGATSGATASVTVS